MSRKYAPGLLGLIQEHYGEDKLPQVPQDFLLPPYTEEEILGYMKSMKHREIVERKVGGKTYSTDDAFSVAVKRKMFEEQLVRGGVKIPPLVGSKVLVDDLVENDEYPSWRDYYRAMSRYYGFASIDPKARKDDKNPDDWAKRVYSEITNVFK